MGLSECLADVVRLLKQATRSLWGAARYISARALVEGGSVSHSRVVRKRFKVPSDRTYLQVLSARAVRVQGGLGGPRG